MTITRLDQDMFQGLDAPTRELVQLAIVIATGKEPAVRAAMVRAVECGLDPVWVEELILQSYLFAGFPRTLNAAREWRRASGRPAPADDEGADPRNAAGRWQTRGEETCRTVYGEMYARLRVNIRELHPGGDLRMSASPHANGGVLLRDLRMPDFRDYAVEVDTPGSGAVEATRVLGGFLRDVMARNGENFLVRHRVRVIAEQLPAPRNGDGFRLLFRTIGSVHGAPLERESR